MKNTCQWVFRIQWMEDSGNLVTTAAWFLNLSIKTDQLNRYENFKKKTKKQMGPEQ